MQLLKNTFTRWFKLPTWKKILIAMALGIVVGLLIGDKAIYLKPIGALFINAIKMMIVPVVFTAIVCAILSMNDLKKMRRVGIKTVILYAISMTVSTIIGLSIATLIAPGVGLSLPASTDTISIGKIPSFAEMIVSIVPTNIITAFSTVNILQILIFSIFIGISINMAGKPAEQVKTFFQSLSSVVFKLTSLVMSFAPYGIFALMADTAGEYGINALLPLFKLILSGYIACLVLCVVFYSLVLKWIARLNPLRFYQGITNAIILAFSSASSTATLPVSVRNAEDNLGISRGIAGFLLPLGTTLNLNGLAIYLSIASVFAANIYGIQLDLTHYVTLVVAIVLTSMGAGGIPGSALIVMGAVMSAIGLPLGAIPLIAGIDRVIDMGMTATNVVGDLFATAVIAKSEGELNQEMYDKENQAPIASNVVTLNMK